jgi:hypothetical protein
VAADANLDATDEGIKGVGLGDQIRIGLDLIAGTARTVYDKVKSNTDRDTPGNYPSGTGTPALQDWSSTKNPDGSRSDRFEKQNGEIVDTSTGNPLEVITNEKANTNSQQSTETVDTGQNLSTE